MFTLHQITTQIPNNSGGFDELHHNINFSLNSSEILLLVGANGVGKSIFMKSLLKIHPSKNLDYQLNDTSLNLLQENQLAAYISLMLAAPPNIELLTAYEVILTGRQRFLSVFSNQENIHKDIIHSLATACGIHSLLNTSFSKLSDGEKQKVMLTRALAQDTPILLLDEPLAFLDYPSRIQFLNLLKEIAVKNSKIILLSSHDIGICLPFCSKILALSKNNHHLFTDPTTFSADEFFKLS